MSHHALQQAVVIALHDPGFVAALHADADRTLAGAGIALAPDERRQLLAVDRRAWRTDPLRARRLLRVLAEELEVLTTLALAETRLLAFAEEFFASRFFHLAVVERAALGPAFGDYLAAAAATGRLRGRQVGEVIRLETATARARRGWSGMVDRARGFVGDPEPDAGGDMVGLAAGIVIGRFNAGVLEAMQRVERYLFELSLMPQAALCDDRPAVPELPEEAGEQHLLFTRAGGNVGLTAIDADLFAVLACFARPVAGGAVGAALAQAAVPAARVGVLIDSLIDEGLLARRLPRAPGADHRRPARL